MKKLFLMLTALILLTPVSAAAAQTPPPTLIIEQVNWADFPMVEIPIFLWQANGTAVKDLTNDQITITEDQNTPFHPDLITTSKNTALDIVLVLDISGSMIGQPLMDAKVAATRFLDRLETNDQAGLIAFSDGVNLSPEILNPERERPISGDIMPLYDLVDTLAAGGATHLYNAAAKAVGFFDPASSQRKAILLLSDGRNDPSDVGESLYAVELAKQAGIPFFVIGLGEDVDDAYLSNLAASTGGLYRKAPTSGELAQLFGEMADLLKTRYTIQYNSQLAPDGAAHSLQININIGGIQSQQTAEFGPLPQPTVEPTTAAPLILITEVEKIITATPQPTLMPVVEPQAPQNGLNWFLIVPLAIAAFILGVILFKRKSKPEPEACARCGRDLTGITGACPDCGTKRRLKKRD